LMIEGSGLVPLTNSSGSGFRRPKNIRIRIRNAGTHTTLGYTLSQCCSSGTI
jgi:hypothetical protein